MRVDKMFISKAIFTAVALALLVPQPVCAQETEQEPLAAAEAARSEFRRDIVGSRPSLNVMLSPELLRSHHGERTAAAPGRRKPSVLALSIHASDRLPPADSPRVAKGRPAITR